MNETFNTSTQGKKKMKIDWEGKNINKKMLSLRGGDSNPVLPQPDARLLPLSYLALVKIGDPLRLWLRCLVLTERFKKKEKKKEMYILNFKF